MITLYCNRTRNLGKGYIVVVVDQKGYGGEPQSVVDGVHLRIGNRFTPNPILTSNKVVPFIFSHRSAVHS